MSSSYSHTNYRQLPLAFVPREVFSFETLVAGSNALMIGILQQCVSGEGEQQIYTWASSRSGKSHIMQAACRMASDHQRSVCYLPAAEMIQQSVSILEDLEQLDLVCIDDIEYMAGSTVWEEALFDLINRMRENGRPLLLSASLSPEAIPVILPDLRSRLAWGPVFQLQPLNDDEKYQALSLRAHQRGLELPQNVFEYLLRRYPRDLFGLFERLEKLDEASMAMQRKLTVPFVKSVLGGSE